MKPTRLPPADAPRRAAARPGMRASGLSASTLKKAALVVTSSATLAAVFLAWQNPHLAVDLANAVWSCF